MPDKRRGVPMDTYRATFFGRRSSKVLKIANVRAASREEALTEAKKLRGFCRLIIVEKI
jgi:hypothetical protein